MNKMRILTVSVFLAVSYTWLMGSLFDIYYADVLFKSSEKLLGRSEAGMSLERINEALKRNPNEPIYYRHRAKIYLFSTVGKDADAISFLKKKAYADLEKARGLNPKNLATLRNSVPLYYFLASKDLQLPAGPDNIDPGYLEIADSYYDRLSLVSPRDVGIQVLLAKYRDRLYLNEDVKESIENIRDLRPDLLEWHESLRDIDVGF
jgi:tetratricopeptide (TPR) repeat protein